MIEVELGPREAVRAATGMVEHRDVGLDALVVHQPSEVLGRAVRRIGSKALRPDAEPILHAINHPSGGCQLSLAHCRACLVIHDHGVFQINQVVGAVGEEGLAALGARSA
jgi:hypothetical protein